MDPPSLLASAPKGGTGGCGRLHPQLTAGSGGGWFEEPCTGSCPCTWLPAPSPAHCRAPFVGKLRLPLPTAPAGLCQGRTLMSQGKANSVQGQCPTASGHSCPPQPSARAVCGRGENWEGQHSPPGSSASGGGQRATWWQPMSPLSAASAHRALGMLPHPAPVANSSPNSGHPCSLWGSQAWGHRSC